MIVVTLKEIIIGYIVIVVISRRAENICGMENGESIEILIIEFVISTIFIVSVIKVNRYVICGV